jgi:hypothetical protein
MGFNSAFKGLNIMREEKKTMHLTEATLPVFIDTSKDWLFM